MSSTGADVSAVTSAATASCPGPLRESTGLFNLSSRQPCSTTSSHPQGVVITSQEMSTVSSQPPIRSTGIFNLSSSQPCSTAPSQGQGVRVISSGELPNAAPNIVQSSGMIVISSPNRTETISHQSSGQSHTTTSSHPQGVRIIPSQEASASNTAVTSRSTGIFNLSSQQPSRGRSDQPVSDALLTNREAAARAASIVYGIASRPSVQPTPTSLLMRGLTSASSPALSSVTTAESTLPSANSSLATPSLLTSRLLGSLGSASSTNLPSTSASTRGITGTSSTSSVLPNVATTSHSSLASLERNQSGTSLLTSRLLGSSPSASAINLPSTSDSTTRLTSATSSGLASVITTSQSTLPSTDTSRPPASLLTARLLGSVYSAPAVSLPSTSALTVDESPPSTVGISHPSPVETCPTTVGTCQSTPVGNSGSAFDMERGESVRNGSQPSSTQGRRPSILRSFLSVQPSTEPQTSRPVAVSCPSSTPHSASAPRNTPIVIYNQNDEAPNNASSNEDGLNSENQPEHSEVASDSSSDSSPSHRCPQRCEICQHQPVLPRPLARPRYLNRRHRWLMRYGTGRRGSHRNAPLARRPSTSANNSDRSQSTQPGRSPSVAQNNPLGDVDGPDRDNDASSDDDRSSESSMLRYTHAHQRMTSLSQFDHRIQQLTARRQEAGRGRVGPRSPRLHSLGQRIQERQRRLRQHLEEIRRR